MLVSKKKSGLSPDELIATLGNSYVPNLVVEGPTDAVVYRRLEDICQDIGLSIIVAGGRSTILTVLGRRDEIKSRLPTYFAMDRDFWILTGTPSSYADARIFFSDGYSIENDALRDAELEKLLTTAERHAYQMELESFIDWYALVLSRVLSGCTEEISLSPHLVLDPVQNISLMQLRSGEVYPNALRESQCKDYQKVVRGKSIFQLLLRQLSAPTRSSKYSGINLLELGVVARGPVITSIFGAVEAVARRDFAGGG